MSRPTTKNELIQAASMNYEKLMTLISSLDDKEYKAPYMFGNDEKKKEAHWKRDHNLRDVLVHLYEWHQLLLHWVEDNEKGIVRPFLPEPYNWKTYGDMNVEFWQKHQNTSLEDAEAMFIGSHEEVMRLLDTFDHDQLFSKGMYAWVGGSTLGSYFISTTSSHYDWAMKKLRAHKKNCKTR